MQENINLKQYNTFHVDCTTRYFLELKSRENLLELSDFYGKKKIVVLGGGANILFTQKNFDGIVAHVQNTGIEVVDDRAEEVLVEVAAGENWGDFVAWAVARGLCGVENLAAIPGSVGAAPVQNIGAYGTEVESVIDCVEVFDMKTKAFKIITKKDCQFAYRYSQFKYQEGNLVIWKVRFILKKTFVANLTYQALNNMAQNYLENNPNSTLNPKIISQMVTQIRNSKLPNPELLGNAGSFFKNPIIPMEKYNKLKMQYPDIVSFDNDKGKKISAGWLLEKCGLKGKRFDKVGMYDKQALVLVNYQEADGEEIICFAKKVIKMVKDKFDIDIEIEVHII